MAVQPASQNWPIEMREVSRAGKMLVLVAADRSGMLSSCVECMYAPSGSFAWTGCFDTVLFAVEWAMHIMCDVVPESRIAPLSEWLIVGGVKDDNCCWCV
jgi:hypothetical protein